MFFSDDFCRAVGHSYLNATTLTNERMSFGYKYVFAESGIYIIVGSRSDKCKHLPAQGRISSHLGKYLGELPYVLGMRGTVKYRLNKSNCYFLKLY